MPGPRKQFNAQRSVALDPAMSEQIQQLADTLSLSESSVIRMLLSEALDARRQTGTTLRRP